MPTAANSIKRREKVPSPGVVVRAALATALALGAVLVVLTAAWLLALAWLSAHARVGARGPASTDELLALGAASVAGSIAAWLCVGTALEVLSHVPGRVGRVTGEWAERLTPALARRVAAFILGLGVGVAGGPSQSVAGPRSTPVTVAPATTPTATPTDAPSDPGFLPTPSTAATTSSVDPGFEGLVAPPAAGVAPTPAEPGFTPAAPRVRPQADPSLIGARPAPASAREVVVHRGDSLWSIAARHLGPDASAAETARAWPLWFEANRDLIGDDPDLILPGQVLRVPDHDHDDHDQTVMVTP